MKKTCIGVAHDTNNPYCNIIKAFDREDISCVHLPFARGLTIFRRHKWRSLMNSNSNSAYSIRLCWKMQAYRRRQCKSNRKRTKHYWLHKIMAEAIAIFFTRQQSDGNLAEYFPFGDKSTFPDDTSQVHSAQAQYWPTISTQHQPWTSRRHD